MLFMVIEHFKKGCVHDIGARFGDRGRMLPDGVIYHASWVDAEGSRCFQIMEAPRPDSLNPWVACWNDLIEFEVIPVQTSADFWAAARQSPA